MRKQSILITGANGEIGRGLISGLHERGIQNIIALDLSNLDDSVTHMVGEAVVGNILDKNLLDQFGAEYEITEIYHLAALLSTRAEFTPNIAHEVNVGGTMNLLNLAISQAKSQGRLVKFFFPSSIAAYGLPDLDTKDSNPKVSEAEFLTPATMYGCNKLYCELLGAYFASSYQQLSAEFSPNLVDFRSIRFPGIISPKTIPSGGTSDFAPEMIHSAIKGEDYKCFVRETTRIPFMTMADAVQSIFMLMETSREKLSQHVYNVSAFNPSAQEFREKIIARYPKASIEYEVSEPRQAIVDSWPADVDDKAARSDWQWKPKHDFDTACEHYLFPMIEESYK